MRNRFLPLLLLVAGCGGAPFTALDEAPVPDAGFDQAAARRGVIDPIPEAAVETTAPETAVPSADAGPIPEAASIVEATVESATPVESGPACATFPTMPVASCHGTGADLSVPQYYAVENGNCGAALTPPECQTPCTYNCLCLAAHWAGCDACRMDPRGLAVCGGG